VLEVRVTKPKATGLFFTGSGAAYRRTMGGTQKLSGADLFIALAGPLQYKVPKPDAPSLLAGLPSAQKRASVVQPLIRGRRVLWVDDQPSNNFYERMALAEMGLNVDVALSSEEGLRTATYLPPDVIVSDMERSGQPEAGMEFLHAVRAHGIRSPVIFYIGDVNEARGVPVSAFAITDRPDSVLHLVLDALERGAG
jgi:CheY-like chemotaxis protein